jgi:transposase
VPGVSVSVVARRQDVNANPVFTWQRRLQQRGPAVEPVPFVSAVIAPEAVARPDPVATKAGQDRRESEEGAVPQRPGVMEIIILAGGRRIIVDQQVNTAALARVIDVLERR